MGYNKEGKVIGVTGHRLAKLGMGRRRCYDPIVYEALVSIAQEYLENMEVRGVLTGMAIGWDQAVADACIILGIPFVAAIPFKGQDRKWPHAGRVKYRKILENAAQSRTISKGGYTVDKMMIRNDWIIDNSEGILTLFNEKGQAGGTWQAIISAKRKGLDITNVWDTWTERRKHIAEALGITIVCI